MLRGVLEGIAYGERHIIKQDVESRRPLHQVLSDKPTNILTLRNQLTGIELRYHALEDFVHNGRQHTLVVVGAESAVDLGESVDGRAGENTASDVDHLQVFCTGQGGDVARFGADIVGDWGFEPGDEEMSSW
jgi:hypothetical protein